MDAPKCKICGHAHWLGDGHVGMQGRQRLVQAAKARVATTLAAKPTKTATAQRKARKGHAKKRAGKKATSQK